MTESRKNIFIAVLTGIIVGFVLGAVFGRTENCTAVNAGDAAANMARIARTGQFRTKTEVQDIPAEKDTIRCEAIDKEGKRTEILIINY